jgi:uncharacterized membrane protein (DUF485 family)
LYSLANIFNIFYITEQIEEHKDSLKSFGISVLEFRIAVAFIVTTIYVIKADTTNEIEEKGSQLEDDNSDKSSLLKKFDSLEDDKIIV